jgi:hypothetical protein
LEAIPLRHLSRFTTASALAVLSAFAVFGQAPVVRTGNTEIGGFVGASYGIDEARVMGGGNVAYALTRAIMPYAEYSYFPGIGRNQGSVHYTIPLNDLNAGVHLRVPIRESKIIPYGVFGMGLIHSSPTTATDVRPDGSTLPVDVPAYNSFAINFGGGLRYYTNERYGFRVEAKVYKPTGTFTDTFAKFEFGFFFQVR